MHPDANTHIQKAWFIDGKERMRQNRRTERALLAMLLLATVALLLRVVTEFQYLVCGH